jgi:hypothetical protein
VTEDAVPSVQRFVVGALVKVPPLLVPQVPFTGDGGCVTVTVTLRTTEVPPIPVQVSEYVVFVVGDTDCVPTIARAPLHPPVAVHCVAFVEDHVRVVLFPETIDVGDTVSVVVGRGTTVTVTLLFALPPAPVQVRVYVREAVKVTV